MEFFALYIKETWKDFWIMALKAWSIIDLLCFLGINACAIMTIAVLCFVPDVFVMARIDGILHMLAYMLGINCLILLLLKIDAKSFS